MLQKLTFNTIVMILAGALLVALLAFGVTQCDKRRNGAAQGRLDTSQANAAQNSAGDAINAVAAAGARETASEDMTRTNDSRIRASEGAGVRVGAGVNLEGRRALCRRKSYENDAKCSMFKGVVK